MCSCVPFLVDLRPEPPDLPGSVQWPKGTLAATHGAYPHPHPLFLILIVLSLRLNLRCYRGVQFGDAPRAARVLQDEQPRHLKLRFADWNKILFVESLIGACQGKGRRRS